MRRMAKVMLISGAVLLLGAGPALACGGLVAPNGSVNLVRTTTLAGYVDGIEHYVTAFEFAGAGGGKLGSIVPLPDVPTRIQKGGRWTLQRLVQEVTPVPDLAFAAEGAALYRSAKVLQEVQVGALDITVLEGGGDEVGLWAQRNGFSLPPDAPEVLDFYAERSPIFMAARFNVKRAKSQELASGDGVGIHLTIPTDPPWVPLRILGLGRSPGEQIEADVFVLTEERPELLPQAALPGAGGGLILERSQPASDPLLADLRSDRGMGWLPETGMHLSYLRITQTAGELTHDLSIGTEKASPSPVAAGLQAPSSPLELPDDPVLWLPWALAALTVAGVLWITGRITAEGP
jgi:hypothetical protein